VRRVSYRLAAARDMRLDFVTRYCVDSPDIGNGSSITSSLGTRGTIVSTTRELRIYL